VETVLVVGGNGNKAVGKMGTGIMFDYGNAMGWDWERSHGNVSEWESKYCPRSPLLQYWLPENSNTIRLINSIFPK